MTTIIEIEALLRASKGVSKLKEIIQINSTASVEVTRQIALTGENRQATGNRFFRTSCDMKRHF